MIEPLRLARLLSLMCSQLDQLAYILYQSAKELTFPAKIIWIFDVEGIKKLLRYQKGHICKKTKYLGRSSSKSSETSNWRTYSFALYFIQVVIGNRSSGSCWRNGENCFEIHIVFCFEMSPPQRFFTKSLWLKEKPSWEWNSGNRPWWSSVLCNLA